MKLNADFCACKLSTTVSNKFQLELILFVEAQYTNCPEQNQALHQLLLLQCVTATWSQTTTKEFVHLKWENVLGKYFSSNLVENVSFKQIYSYNLEKHTLRRWSLYIINAKSIFFILVLYAVLYAQSICVIFFNLRMIMHRLTKHTWVDTFINYPSRSLGLNPMEHLFIGPPHGKLCQSFGNCLNKI